MSTQTLNRFEWLKAVMQVEGLSATTKNVAGALAIQFANGETGQINPSQETVADFLKVHRDTVKRARRELRNAGWLMTTGDGGRGKSPMLRLLSPGKIVPFRPRKGGQIAPQNSSERGADVHPQAEERGDDLQQKGGEIVPPHNKEEQYKEQKERIYQLFRDHRFADNPFAGPVPIQPDQWQRLDRWTEWLNLNRLPKLCEMPIFCQDAKGRRFFALPSREPPSTVEQAEEARRYFEALIDHAGARHAAQ